MNKEEIVSRLIVQFYDGILQPDRWFSAVEGMRSLFDASVAHVLCWDAEHSVDRLAVVTEYGLTLRDDYERHFGEIDPRLGYVNQIPVGKIFSCYEHFSESFVERDEFYQDFLVPRVGRYSMGAAVLRTKQFEVQLGITRVRSAGAFEVEEQRLLTVLLPHLEKALSLTLARAQERTQNTLSNVAMDISHFAMFALSAVGTVLAVNQRAEALLRHGTTLCMSEGRLLAIDPSEDNRLRDTIRFVVSANLPRNLLFHGPDGDMGLTLIPSAESQRSLGISDSPQVIAILTEFGSKRLATVRQLMELFSLSPAEARLVRGLAQGESLESYADGQGVKRTTVRTQLQSALGKVGVGTQKDLVRMIHELPAVRSE